MSEIKVTPLNINQVRELGEKDRSLYVINTTDQRQSQSRGDLHIQVNDDFGQAQNIIIPNTWIPFDLARYGSVKPMIRSKGFLDALARRNLIVLADDDAKKILDTPEAKEESKKIDEKYKRIGTGGHEETYTVQATPTIVNDVALQPSELDQSKNEINPSDDKLREMYLKFSTGQMREQEFIDQINKLAPAPSAAVIQEISSMGRMSPNVMHTIGNLMAGSDSAQVAQTAMPQEAFANRDPINITT